MSDVKGLTLYDKQEKTTVRKSLDLPYKDEEAQQVLDYWLNELRETAIKGVLHNGN